MTPQTATGASKEHQTRTTWREALACGSLAAGVVAPIAYLVQRLYERSQGGVPNPTLVLREAHTSFYWRTTTAAWWAGLIGIAVFAWMMSRPPASARFAARVSWWMLPLLPAVLLAAYLYP